MSITEIVILTLLGIDIANVLMIAYVFRWAKNAIHKFREITVELLSTDNPESQGIIQHLTESVTMAVRNQLKGQLVTLVRQLYSQGVSALQSEETEEPSSQVQSPVPAKLASKAGEMLGIDPAYIPTLLKLYEKMRGDKTAQASNTISENW